MGERGAYTCISFGAVVQVISTPLRLVIHQKKHVQRGGGGVGSA
jgi:hypothetical protein